METSMISIKRPTDFRRWLVVMSAALIFFYTFVQINMMNPLSEPLMQSFNISATKLGELSSLVFWTNFLFVFPAGLFIDRFSAAKTIFFAMVISTLSMFVFAFAPNIYIAGAARLVTGITGAFCVIAPIKIATRWFRPNQLALVSGCVITMGMIGGIVAQTPLVILINKFGWREATVALGILGILATLMIGIFVRNQSPDYESFGMDNAENAQKIGFWQGIKGVLMNRYNWFNGIYAGALNLPIFLLGALWGGMFLMQADHLDPIHASYISSALFFGSIFGSPMMGWISDKIGRRKSPLIFSALSCLVLVWLIIYSSNLSFSALLVLFFLLGFFCMAQTICYPTVVELNRPAFSGSATSIISLMIMFVTFIAQPLFGYLMDLHWKHVMINNEAIYAVTDYHSAMIVFPIAFIVSLIMALLIRETRCRSVYETP